MPFPITGIIDNFNRADETPLASPWILDPPNQSWVLPNLASNAAIGSVASNYSSGYHNANTFARPCEVYGTVGSASAEWRVGFIQNPDSASASGYMFAHRTDDVQRIWRITDTAFTTIAAVTQAVATGSVCGLHLAANGDLTAYDDGVSILTINDTTHTGPFYLWFAMFDTAKTLDNFGGGTLGDQLLLPDADIAAGGWTTAPLFSKLNDSSDATFITSTAA